MHFITGVITQEVFNQLNKLVWACRLLDMVDNGQRAVTPEGYQEVARTARAVMHELDELQLPHIVEVLDYLASVSNTACELLEARNVEKLLVVAPERLKELAKVLKDAKDPTAQAARSTPVLSIFCRQGAERDHVHITGVALLDANSRSILETILRAVAEPFIEPDSMTVSTSAGNGDSLARMLYSTLSARSIAVRATCQMKQLS